MSQWSTRSNSVPLRRWPPSLQRLQIPFQVSSVDGGMRQRASMRDHAHSMCCSALRVMWQVRRWRRLAELTAHTAEEAASACSVHRDYALMSAADLMEEGEHT